MTLVSNYQAISAAFAAANSRELRMIISRKASWVASFCLLIAGATVAADQEAVAANQALAKAFETAWNTHDMDPGLRKLVADDIDWVNVDGGYGKGVEQIVSGHVNVHKVKFKESVMTVKEVEVALVRPDVAVVHVKWGVRGDLNNDGTAREPREGIFTWVTVKEGEVWKIRASHNSNKQQIH
jgi:uncharacterized protein (TIGR02246 family)